MSSGPIKPPRSNLGTKFDRQLAEQLYRELRRGVPLDVALDYLSFAPSKFWNWYRRGELYLKGVGAVATHQKYGTFVEMVKKSSAFYLRRRVRDAGRNNDWRRHIAILERRDRKNWSKKAPPGGGLDAYDPDERFL